MRGSPEPLRERAAWQALARHHAEIGRTHLRELFAADPGRAERLAGEAGGLFVDYSKNRVTDETIGLLVALAQEQGVLERRDAMFAGQAVNATESRPALHVALRMPRDRSVVVEGRDVVRDVHDVLDRMSAFAHRVRSGEWTGHGGRPIRAVVNIGIGGSDLGPAMTTRALRHYARRDLSVRYVANVDGTDLAEATFDLDPHETLFVVASKSFTTPETMANARSAREWALAVLRDEGAVASHFAAVTARPEEARAFGIDPGATFELWDWVGGRFSLDSAVGLSTMLAIGPERFRELLGGLHAMDEHFLSAPPERNLPLVLGLITTWYVDFFGVRSAAVVPYEQYLDRFPAYLQQLAMESNGKSVDESGEPVRLGTSPVYFGEPGTNAQHSFFQLLHQGTQLVPCDLIVFGWSLNPLGSHHDLLVANCFAQAEALAFGRPAAEIEDEGVPAVDVPHRVCPGNRPSTTILAERLTPASLGSLIALYEHAVFTQGAVWGIDPFDQWGVELGKTLAGRIGPELWAEGEPELRHDASTNALVRRYRELRGRT